MTRSRHSVRRPSPRRLGDLVISAADELDKTESVAEGIGEHDVLAPGSQSDLRLCPRASSHGTGQRHLDIVDHHVEVERGPMSIVWRVRLSAPTDPACSSRYNRA